LFPDIGGSDDKFANGFANNEFANGYANRLPYRFAINEFANEFANRLPYGFTDYTDNTCTNTTATSVHTRNSHVLYCSGATIGRGLGG
jgi:hypothetical protein